MISWLSRSGQVVVLILFRCSGGEAEHSQTLLAVLVYVLGHLG